MNKTITEKQFEALPKAEQNFRWAVFLASNGYEKELTALQIDQLRERYVVRQEPFQPKKTFKGTHF